MIRWMEKIRGSLIMPKSLLVPILMVVAIIIIGFVIFMRYSH